jgi:NADP-dependent 3-hydroxy acid dehydrogenase YdfG
MTNKIILITGATSGFGKAIAEKYAAQNYNLIICGRRIERLNKLKQDLEEKYSIKVLISSFDIQNKEAVKAAVEAIPTEWKSIDILINNAGLAAGLSEIQNGNFDDWDTMIDTNLKGVLYITRLISPLMMERKQGHIFNIGSIAGKYVYPKGNVYCATKHAVNALNEAMRIDLLPYNIKVTAIHPGAAETEFSLVRFKGDEKKAKSIYDGFTPLNAENIADIVWFCSNQPAHVCINDLVVTPITQANSHHSKKNN